jgi:hypothetical protein
MASLSILTLTTFALLSSSAIALALNKSTRFAILVGCGVFSVFVVVVWTVAEESADDGEEQKDVDGKKKRRKRIRRKTGKECWSKRDKLLGRGREVEWDVAYGENA